MSYILDALRRAEIERQRGLAPALQQVTQLPPVHARRNLAPAAGLAALAIVGGGLIWVAMVYTPREPAVSAGAAAPATSIAVATPAAALARPATTTQALPQAVPRERPAPARAAPADGGPPGPVAERVASGIGAAPGATPVRAPDRAPPPAPAAAPAPPAPSPPAPAETRPVPVHTLPEPQRSRVLQLAIGGVVHSADRQQRFVMIGGQIVREGDTLAPGLKLERIEPRALILHLEEQLVQLPL